MIIRPADHRTMESDHRTIGSADHRIIGPCIPPLRRRVHKVSTSRQATSHHFSTSRQVKSRQYTSRHVHVTSRHTSARPGPASHVTSRQGMASHVLYAWCDTCPTCDIRVQSATEWIASVHILHMPKPLTEFVFKVLRNGLLRYKSYTCQNL